MATLTAISVSTDANPSIGTLQWSEDGQAVLVTRNTLYILTPGLGILFDPDGKSKPFFEGDETDTTGASISWYRTMINLDKDSPHVWGNQSQEHSTLVLGSLDASWKSVCWSPSNLSPTATCLLVTLGTNLELTVWAPSTNQLKGRWRPLCDLTELLKGSGSSVNDEMDEGVTTLRLLRAQAVSVSWSQQPAYNVEPKCTTDTSILAVGSRAGSVELFRFNPSSQAMVMVHSIHLSDDWITHLAWSRWKLVDGGKCECRLACSTPSGEIRFINVTQTINITGMTEGYKYQPLVEAEIIIPEEAPSFGGRQTTLSLLWISVDDKETLVLTNPGTVRLWCQPSGFREIQLQRQRTCSGSSPLLPTTGVAYFPSHDILLVALSDSSVNVIYDVSGEPSLAPPAGGRNTPTPAGFDLARVVRDTCRTVEEKNFTSGDMILLSGMVPYDTFGTMMWFYEARRPQDFDYKAEAKRRSLLVVKQLWNEGAWDGALQTHILAILRAPTGRLYHAPLATLRAVLLALHQPNIFFPLRGQLLELLDTEHDLIADDAWVTPLPTVGPSSENDVSTLRKILHEHFSREFYASGASHVLRLKLNIANMVSRTHNDSAATACASNMTQCIIVQRAAILLRALIHFGPFLTDPDRAFAFRTIAFAATTLTEYSNIQTLVQILGSQLQAHPAAATRASARGSNGENLEEECPACRAPMLLNDFPVARCPDGHVWTRCSITSFVLASPMARSCQACCRKALVSASQSGTLHARPNYGWFVEELLESARSCLFCGNRFVRIL